MTTPLASNRVRLGLAALVAITIIAVAFWFTLSRGSESQPDDASTQTNRSASRNENDVGAGEATTQPPKSDNVPRPEVAELVKRNEELENELRREQQESRFAGDILTKLADPSELEVPETDQEIVVFAGMAHRAAVEFAMKWDGEIPPDESPDRALYDEESEALSSTMASMMKSFESYKGEDPTSSSESLARFQSLQMYGALELSNAEWESVDGILQRQYQDGFSRNLRAVDQQPETNIDEWNQQRREISERAHREIQAILPADKHEFFKRAYDPSHFFWTFSIGG